MQDFEKLIKLLLGNNVEFILIGGFAATVHGVSLLTQDIDVCITFDEHNAERLLKSFRNCHPVHRDNKKPLNETPKSLAKYKNLYLLTDFGSIDFLGFVSNLGTYSEILPHTLEIDLFEHKCKVLDIDALILSKKQMNRPKDKETIIQLKAIKEKLEK